MCEPIEPLSVKATFAVTSEVLAPLIARGLIARRRRALGVLSKLDSDRRACERLCQLRQRHGDGPALLTLPRRRLAVVLSPEDARTVLELTSDPFTPANREKRAALAQFEPHGVLISSSADRPSRRRLNELALETDRPVHRLGDAIAAAVESEMGRLTAAASDSAWLYWPEFEATFRRLVRRIVFGEAAAGDSALTDQLLALRRDANWSYLRPVSAKRRARFLRLLRHEVAEADADSITGHMVGGEAAPDLVDRITSQVPQWLFAFDAVGIAAFTTLALLSTHPVELKHAREEIETSRTFAGPPKLPFLRACVLESLRLWPTTPAILRDTTKTTVWENGALPAGTIMLIFAPFFHRYTSLDPTAERFRPARWLGDDACIDGPSPFEADAGQLSLLMPFSRGPAACPGRDVVLLTASLMLAALLSTHEFRLRGKPGLPKLPGPLPGTISHFKFGFDVQPWPGA